MGPRCSGGSQAGGRRGACPRRAAPHPPRGRRAGHRTGSLLATTQRKLTSSPPSRAVSCPPIRCGAPPPARPPGSPPRRGNSSTSGRRTPGLDLARQVRGAQSRDQEPSGPKPAGHPHQDVPLLVARGVDDGVEGGHRVKGFAGQGDGCGVPQQDEALPGDIAPGALPREISTPVTSKRSARSRVVGTPEPQPRSSTAEPGATRRRRTSVYFWRSARRVRAASRA